MNSYQAKKGFLTFLALTITIVTMSIFVNFIFTQNTQSEIKATGSIITFLPESDLLIIVGIPMLLIGIIITAIKRSRHKYL
ncbi:MAG: hypothetical protein O2871_00640 [bacterium]|jgi:lipoprotein signal peptidase|nr:hypothetical protein [bacterium]